MQIWEHDRFRAERPWGSVLLMDMGEHQARLHWTDRPFQWHVNDGEEVFVVLDGEVDMHYGPEGRERRCRLRAGDTAVIAEGERHVAHPVGEARVLVVERRRSP
jgi:mannose-6-phosphate isomerase-like protein (cupin superfamily)